MQPAPLQRPMERLLVPARTSKKPTEPLGSTAPDIEVWITLGAMGHPIQLSPYGYMNPRQLHCLWLAIILIAR